MKSFKISFNQVLPIFASCFLFLEGISQADVTSYQANALSRQGAFSVGIGYYSLQFNTTQHNTAVGYNALHYTSTGNNNVGLGSQAMFFNTLGNENTAVGFEALFSGTQPVGNTAIGFRSNRQLATGAFNTAVGYYSLYNNLTGNRNTAIGHLAGYKNLGSNNVFIGEGAGYFELGSDKFYVAKDSLNTLVYGDMGTGQVLLGNPNPAGYVFGGAQTLNVIGGLLVDSARVALTSEWPDYVFDQNYKKPTVEYLRTYIQNNRRLPDMPSADEVKANGIELGNMQALLLKKIEELTLIIIEQDKKIKDLENLVMKKK